MRHFPIFDSLVHPSIAGSWLGREADATFARLDKEMETSETVAACAVGLEGMDGFESESFMRRCSQFPRLVPIAGYRPATEKQLGSDMSEIKALGYRGIKLHPRFSSIDYFSPLLGATMEAAGAAGLVVFYCTYCHCAIPEWPRQDPFYGLIAALQSAPGARVVLLHGGDVELLRYMQLVRFNPNLLLDLSMTLCKYPGSSLDADLGFAFENFDRRICIGSDWPQHSLVETRARFEHFARTISDQKACGIAGGNLARFLGMNDGAWL